METDKEVRDDIIHIVNVLICLARDGQYDTPKHRKLYGQFRKMVHKFEPVRKIRRLEGL